MNSLSETLSQIEPISLEEMGNVKLMNRIDSKFPTNMEVLHKLAEHWRGNFFVQEHENKRIAHYKSLYFDTSDAITYTMHHNRRLHRQKIRQRIYVDSDIAFCEIKNKKNTGRTKKKRVQIPVNQWGNLYSNEETKRFINEKVWVTKEQLFPRLENDFQRITLVNKEKTERITIDFGITFRNHVSNLTADVSDLVIIEVKQDGNHPSRFKELLRQERVKQKGLSKYCLGMLLTDENIKYNRFKAKIRYINKLTKNNFSIKSQIQ